MCVYVCLSVSVFVCVSVSVFYRCGYMCVYVYMYNPYKEINLITTPMK